MARGPRPGRGSPEVRARAKRIAGKRTRRDFGERFLKRLGFGEGDFKKGGLVKQKLGLFGGAVTSKSSGQAGPGPAPSVETPERVSNKANPSIATIVGQLDNLVKTAKKVGILTKEQQEAMLGQLSQARRISKEQILENKQPAIPEPVSTDASASLSPLADVIEDLKKQIDKLTNKVEDKVDEQDDDSNNRGFLERFFDRRGLGDDYRQRQARKPAQARRNLVRNIPESQLLDKNGNPLNWKNRERRIAKILKDGAPAATATRTVGARVTSAVSSTRIAKAIGAGASRSASLAKLGGTSIKAAVKRAAGPIIAKGLGKTALKSIPIIGAVAGVGFAVDRLVKGDVLGAGLDLVSGLGGPLTAIPALVASTARDVYSSVFGVQPESDPEVGKRMSGVQSAVEELVKEQLGSSVQPKQKPTQSQVDQKTVPTTPPQKPPTKESGPSLGTPQAPTSPTAPASSAPSSGAGSAPAAPASDASMAGTATGESKPITDGATKQSAEITNTGMDIIKASTVPPVVIPSLYGFNQQSGRFLPQRSQTSKSGHVGIGNVPSPDYTPSGTNNLPGLYSVMFFNVNYQEQ